MKSSISIVLILICSSSLFAEAKYWSEISAEFNHLGCTFYLVDIWSDGGTPNNPNDDSIVGNGSIVRCGGIPAPDPTTSEIKEIYEDVESGCLFFDVTVTESNGEETSGVIEYCE